jgi:3-deoxy-D-manno-octulosonic acid (KDO) 8-phosphate synthase
MTPLGFEPTISAGERPQIDALDRAATGTGLHASYSRKMQVKCRNTLKSDRPQHVVSNKFRQILSKLAAIKGASFVSIHVQCFPQPTTHVSIWIQILFHLPLKKV